MLGARMIAKRAALVAAAFAREATGEVVARES
jgi:hypothetical protein